MIRKARIDDVKAIHGLLMHTDEHDALVFPFVQSVVFAPARLRGAVDDDDRSSVLRSEFDLGNLAEFVLWWCFRRIVANKLAANWWNLPKRVRDIGHPEGIHADRRNEFLCPPWLCRGRYGEPESEDIYRLPQLSEIPGPLQRSCHDYKPLTTHITMPHKLTPFIPAEKIADRVTPWAVKLRIL